MKLVIVRGLPGSGKTTYAQSRNYLVVEGDQFRYNDDGVYEYARHKDKAIFLACRDVCTMMIEDGYSVTVANTFLTQESIRPFINMGKLMDATIEIKEMKGEYDNSHGVSRDIIASMVGKWEALKPEWERYKI